MNNRLKIEEELEKTDFSMKLLYLKSKNWKETSEIYNQIMQDLAIEYLVCKNCLIKYRQCNYNYGKYVFKYSNLDDIKDTLIRAGYLEPKVKTKTK